ncbi:MAG: type II toxin-antitoxin system VapB family antitoxin [Leptospiraceae bacterium]|nr:type II toxin-antitoxin system VapB family antitoxin [Leptospiraceae bacterium]
MKTTVVIPENLIKEAMEITGIKEKTKLIKFGLEEIIRRKRLEELANMFGSAKGKAKYIKRSRGT